MRIRLVLSALGMIITLTAAPAQAQPVNEGNWTDGFTSVSCGSGDRRLCIYDFQSSDCIETSAMGDPVVYCHVRIYARVPVVTVVNTAGAATGCTVDPRAMPPTGFMSYRSTSPLFSNPEMSEDLAIHVSDSFVDKSAGLLHFLVVDTKQGQPIAPVWVGDAVARVACAENSTGYWLGGSGSVAVHA